MQRRTFALALAAILSLPVMAHADLVAPPPAPIDVRAVRTEHGGAGGPRTARWEIHNRGQRETTVRIARAVALIDAMRLPLRITGARVDGRETREVTIPSNGTVTVEVSLEGFEGPSSTLDSWTIELALEVRPNGEYHDGHAAGTTQVTRARRTASR